MGRKVPVLALQTGEWRGIANGAIAEPEQAFGYVSLLFLPAEVKRTLTVLPCIDRSNAPSGNICLPR